MIRKIVVMMVVCAVVLSVWGVANVQAKDEIVIGAAASTFADKWLSFLHDGITKFGDDHDDVKIMMTDGRDDPGIQLGQVETLLTQGVDALIIVPVDISTMGPMINSAKDAGVPVVVVNRLPEEEFVEQIDVYCGSESIQAGIMQAEWVAEALQPDGGKIAIITGVPGQEAAIMRTEGNRQVFAKYENIEIVADTTGKWDRALGMQVAENWYQAYPDLKAVVANNDEMAIGALLAAQALGIKDEELIIAGVDATPDALEFLGQGLDVTVFQSALGQGYGGAEAAYKLAKGEPVEKMQWIPYELVTVENMADYQ
jgi:inositol transport system substrate-binding protein